VPNGLAVCRVDVASTVENKGEQVATRRVGLEEVIKQPPTARERRSPHWASGATLGCNCTRPRFLPKELE
jgi:hypothetical protein